MFIIYDHGMVTFRCILRRQSAPFRFTLEESFESSGFKTAGRFVAGFEMFAGHSTEEKKIQFEL